MLNGHKSIGATKRTSQYQRPQTVSAPALHRADRPVKSTLWRQPTLHRIGPGPRECRSLGIGCTYWARRRHSDADPGKGLKFIGPELAITNALYKGAAGGTVHDVCVVATEGGFGYFAGDAGADLGAAAGAAVPGAEPVTIPLFAILGGYAFGKFGESLGTKVGETFCP